MAEEKFELFESFCITVPADYEHAQQLGKFRKSAGGTFEVFDERITDKNFEKVTARPFPGQEIEVRVFLVWGAVTSEDCLKFIKSQEGSVLMGAQGLSLVWGLEGRRLPLGQWYLSFDRPDRLLAEGGVPMVPYISRYLDGDCYFGLTEFSTPHTDDDALLAFFPLNPQSA